MVNLVTKYLENLSYFEFKSQIIMVLSGPESAVTSQRLSSLTATHVILFL
jgi:hypothetical protein